MLLPFLSLDVCNNAAEGSHCCGFRCSLSNIYSAVVILSYIKQQDTNL